MDGEWGRSFLPGPRPGPEWHCGHCGNADDHYYHTRVGRSEWCQDCVNFEGKCADPGDPPEVCRAFRNTGKCRYGHACRHEHSAGPRIPRPAMTAEQQYQQREAARMCCSCACGRQFSSNNGLTQHIKVKNRHERELRRRARRPPKRLGTHRKVPHRSRTWGPAAGGAASDAASAAGAAASLAGSSAAAAAAGGALEAQAIRVAVTSRAAKATLAMASGGTGTRHARGKLRSTYTRPSRRPSRRQRSVRATEASSSAIRRVSPYIGATESRALDTRLYRATSAEQLFTSYMRAQQHLERASEEYGEYSTATTTTSYMMEQSSTQTSAAAAAAAAAMASQEAGLHLEPMRRLMTAAASARAAGTAARAAKAALVAALIAKGRRHLWRRWSTRCEMASWRRPRDAAPKRLSGPPRCARDVQHTAQVRLASRWATLPRYWATLVFQATKIHRMPRPKEASSVVVNLTKREKDTP